MKKYMVIAFICISIAVASLVIRKQIRDKTGGLGKASLPDRPPKVRIVYSRNQKSGNRIKIKSSLDAYILLKDIWSKQMETREEMIILLLDRSNSVLGYDVLSMGGITGTVADIRLLYSVALNSLATGIIMSHNHPSGNLAPSESDIELTQKVKKAGKVMDIHLLDHLVISPDRYYSFADEGML